jgi:uncharacterized protein YndB with AHSA1/START domain
LEKMTLPNFVIERFFGTTPDKFWQAWTQQALLQRWLRLKGSTLDVAHFDVRPGGYTLSVFAFPGEPLMRVKFDYLEVAAPKRLTWLHSFVDPQGNTIRHPFNAKWPLQTLIAVTFDHALAEQTRVTLTWTPVDASEEEQKAFGDGIVSMQTVWEVNFQHLADLVAHEK